MTQELFVSTARAILITVVLSLSQLKWASIKCIWCLRLIRHQTMDTEQAHLVRSPSELATLATSQHIPSHIRLALLQPLGDPDVLASCRDPDSRYSRDPAGNRCGLTDYEYLDIRKLSKAWREVWSTFPPSIDRVTFELSLPSPSEGSERLCWDTAITSGGGVGVIQGHVQRLVLTLSTVMAIRSRKSVRFDVAYHPPEHLSRLRAILDKALAGLSRSG